MQRLRVLVLFATMSIAGSAQGLRQEVSVGAGALSPLSGFIADGRTTGFDLRVGYQLRLKNHIGAELGWTGAWPSRTEFGRDFDQVVRDRLQLVDYGVRGIVPVARDRVELSAGIGGGYIWYDQGPSNSYLNSSLLQYSGRVAAPLNSRRRLWIGVTFRAWRDLGRPTQQWLSTTGDLTYRFGR
jgi:hypothetical protein